MKVTEQPMEVINILFNKRKSLFLECLSCQHSVLLRCSSYSLIPYTCLWQLFPLSVEVRYYFCCMMSVNNLLISFNGDCSITFFTYLFPCVKQTLRRSFVKVQVIKHCIIICAFEAMTFGFRAIYVILLFQYSSVVARLVVIVQLLFDFLEQLLHF